LPSGICAKPRAAVAALHAQGEVAVLRFDPARRQFDVLARSALSTSAAVRPRAASVAVQPDPHRVALAAAQRTCATPFELETAVDHVALGVVGQLQRVHRGRAHVQPDDRVGIALDLADLRRIGLFGMRSATRLTASRTSLAAASMSRLAGELDADRRRPLRLRDSMVFDALDAGQRVFQDLGDAGFDHAGRRARIGHLTDTMGGSIAGSSRRVRRMNDITPSTTSSRLITTASTGRLIERSDSFMAYFATQ
jgi:hypothetical protein